MRTHHTIDFSTTTVPDSGEHITTSTSCAFLTHKVLIVLTHQLPEPQTAFRCACCEQQQNGIFPFFSIGVPSAAVNLANLQEKGLQDAISFHTTGNVWASPMELYKVSTDIQRPFPLLASVSVLLCVRALQIKYLQNLTACVVTAIALY
jgi:hypothetical protein